MPAPHLKYIYEFQFYCLECSGGLSVEVVDGALRASLLQSTVKAQCPDCQWNADIHGSEAQLRSVLEEKDGIQSLLHTFHKGEPIPESLRRYTVHDPNPSGS